MNNLKKEAKKVVRRLRSRIFKEQNHQENVNEVDEANRKRSYEDFRGVGLRIAEMEARAGKRLHK